MSRAKLADIVAAALLALGCLWLILCMMTYPYRVERQAPSVSIGTAMVCTTLGCSER